MGHNYYSALLPTHAEHDKMRTSKGKQGYLELTHLSSA